MLAMARQVILFVGIILLGFYLTDLNTYRDEKGKHKKAWEGLIPYIWRAIVLVGPWIIVLIILGLIFNS